MLSTVIYCYKELESKTSRHMNCVELLTIEYSLIKL